jgi:hypothetical protein
MGLLAPLFLLGLAAVAVPVLLHLTQRARRDPVRFPSLAFVRKVPFKTTERRHLRDRLLLLLRAATLGLLAVAFARPLFERDVLGTAGAAAAREVVILLDGSASMGYGDRWRRARDAVRPWGNAGPRTAPRPVRRDTDGPGPPTGTRSSSSGYLTGVEPHGGVTPSSGADSRGISLESTRPRSTVVLITDFQRRDGMAAPMRRLPVRPRPASAGTTIPRTSPWGVMLRRSPERRP